MLVGPLKNNIQLSIVILLMVCLGIWGSSFVYTNIDPSDLDNSEHVLYHYIFDRFMAFRLKQIIALFVVLTGALFLNFLAIEQEMVSKTNYLPSFFYIIFSFSYTTKNAVEPILVANLFILPALYFLTNTYRKDQVMPQLFNTGLFMGLASFFCIQYIIVFPLSYIALLILRPFNLKEAIILTLGLLTPMYCYLCISYLVNTDIMAVLDKLNESVINFQKPSVSEFYITFLVVTILLFLFAMFFYISKGFGGKIKTQKTKYILLWMLLFCLIIALFDQTSEVVLISGIVPLSIILGDYLAEVKQLKIANTLLLLFIGGFLIVFFHALGII